MSPETTHAHKTGLALSIPATLIFISMSSISAGMNTAFLLVAGVVFIAALPWSIISVFIFLSVVPMNTGLHSGMDGYCWRVLLAYSAPVITILGAHFNGFMFGRSRARSSKQKNNNEISKAQLGSNQHAMPNPSFQGTRRDKAASRP